MEETQNESTNNLGKMQRLVSGLLQVVQMESEIIDELFKITLQYMTVEEIEQQALLERIKSVSELRTALEA